MQRSEGPRKEMCMTTVQCAAGANGEDSGDEKIDNKKNVAMQMRVFVAGRHVLVQ